MSDTATANKEIVQQWIDEVFNQKKLSSVDQLKVSSYLDWTPLPPRYQDVELPVSGIKDAIPGWFEALPDFEFAADRLMAEDDFVVCLGRWSAHHEGDYRGHEASHRPVGGTRIDIFRVAGDKMVEHWGCGNELLFLQMVGQLDSASGVEVDAPDTVASAFVRAILADRDLSAVAGMIDASATDHGVAFSMLDLLHGFAALEVEVVGIESDGSTVTVTTRFEGDQTGPFAGIEATGRHVAAERTDRFVVQSGKIVQAERCSDDDDLLSQLRR